MAIPCHHTVHHYLIDLKVHLDRWGPDADLPQSIVEHGDDGARDGIWGYFLRQAVSTDLGVPWMIFQRLLLSVCDKY
jgi:hypothetical protein